MDIVNPGLLGSRESFDRTLARPIEAYGDEKALERLRGIVRPFVLRRAKDDPEVELELPPITIGKDYCKLTVEQASLYQATVDRWMPRIEEQQETFGQRGSVLAMLSQLKRVCNHPELLLATGQPLEGRSGKLDRLVELLEQVPAGRQGARLHAVPGLRPARAVSARPARHGGRLLPRAADRAAARRGARGVRAAGRPVGARDLDQGGRPRASTCRRRTTSSTSTAGGTPRSSSRRPTVCTASASASRCSCTVSSAPARSRSGSTQLLESKRELAAKVMHGALGGLARQPRHRRDPRRRRALAGLDGGGRRHERADRQRRVGAPLCDGGRARRRLGGRASAGACSRAKAASARST